MYSRNYPFSKAGWSYTPSSNPAKKLQRFYQTQFLLWDYSYGWLWCSFISYINFSNKPNILYINTKRERDKCNQYTYANPDKQDVALSFLRLSRNVPVITHWASHHQSPSPVLWPGIISHSSVQSKICITQGIPERLGLPSYAHLISANYGDTILITILRSNHHFPLKVQCTLSGNKWWVCSCLKWLWRSHLALKLS